MTMIELSIPQISYIYIYELNIYIDFNYSGTCERANVIYNHTFHIICIIFGEIHSHLIYKTQISYTIMYIIIAASVHTRMNSSVYTYSILPQRNAFELFIRATIALGC